MHIVPEIDDGSSDINESLQMLHAAHMQGVTDVFCTSHSGSVKENPQKYLDNFNALKEAVQSANIDVKIHKGCEVLCSGKTIDEVLSLLETGAFTTLGNSKYVLTELYPDLPLSEALFIIEKLKSHGYHPIIAHMERIFSLTGEKVGALIKNGALIQVNVQNFVDETEQRERARQLLDKKYIHFIGSDAHNLTGRPPRISQGVEYILNNTDADYAKQILFGSFNPSEQVKV